VNSEELRDWALEAGFAGALVPRHFILGNEFLPFALIVVEADAQNNQRFTIELLDDVADVRKRLAAGTAPGCPEVDEDNLAFQVIQRYAFSFDIVYRECRSHAGAVQFRVLDVAQSTLAIGIAFRPSLGEVCKFGTGFIVAVQVGERLPITEDSIRKIRRCSQGFG